jgi:hypothetical protein
MGDFKWFDLVDNVYRNKTIFNKNDMITIDKAAVFHKHIIIIYCSLFKSSNLLSKYLHFLEDKRVIDYLRIREDRFEITKKFDNMTFSLNFTKKKLLTGISVSIITSGYSNSVNFSFIFNHKNKNEGVTILSEYYRKLKNGTL